MTEILKKAIEYDKKMVRAFGQYKIPQAQYYYSKLHTLIELDKSLAHHCPGLKLLRKFMREIRNSQLYKESV